MKQQCNYLLIDGAKALSRLSLLTDSGVKFECLYKGKPASSLAKLAPYLFEYNATSQLATIFKELGWGNAWGIPLTAPVEFIELYSHFRRFLMVQTEDFKQLYFRFYDPRVLREFLPTCQPDQLKDFFGPVTGFICEDEDLGNGLIYSLKERKLKVERRSQKDLFDLI